MTDNDLFSSKGETQPTTVPENPDHDFVNELVGEGKKFKDLQSLARSVLHKDMHIRDIESENAELRQLAHKGLTREEFYEAIKALKEPSPSSSTQTGGEQERNEVSIEQVRSLVAESVNQTLTEQKQQENLAFAVAKAKEVLGPGFQKILMDRARELGENPDDLTRLAMAKPKVFLELMIPKHTETHIPSLPRSEVDPIKQSVSPSGEIRNASYYKKLRLTDPKKYKSPETEVQMHKDALALGEKFFQ